MKPFYDYLTTDDSRLYYVINGDGEPVVLLHGNFNDHRIWDRQIAELADKHKVIRYDLRGFGQSDTPKTPYSNVEDLKTLIDQLRLPKVSLIGSSSGGGVAIDFALAYPHMVKGLILAAPTVTGYRYPIRMLWKAIKNYAAVRSKGAEAAIEQFISDPYWDYFFPAPSKDPLHRQESNKKTILGDGQPVEKPLNFMG